MSNRSFYQRYAILILGTAVGLVPLVAVGVRQAIRSNSNDVRDWLPEHYPETAQLRWFRQCFGSQDFVVASWPGCTLDDPRLDRFAERLIRYSQEGQPQGTPRLFCRVVTGRSLMAELTGPPLALGREEVVDRLRGSLVGPDGLQTGAAITLTDEARLTPQPTLDTIYALGEQIGLPRGEIRLGGTPVINAAINQASTQSLHRLAGLSGLIGLTVAWWCFRNLRLTIVVFLAGVYSAGASLAVVPLVGARMNAILITMTPLVYVAAISGAIHLANYFRDAMAEGHPEDAVDRAVAHAGVPLGLAAGTTALGLLSLWYNDLSPIRMFGLFSAIGVVLGLAVQFLPVPAALALGRPTLPQASVSQHHAKSVGARLFSPPWRRYGEWVIKHHLGVSLACLGVLGAGAMGLARVETSIQIMRLFSRDMPVVPTYAWLESHLGALVPLEVVLRFDAKDSRNVLPRIRLVQEVQKKLAELPEVGASLSAATFAPRIDYGAAVGATVRRSVFSARLRSRDETYLQTGYLARAGGQELWRIGVRVKGVNDLDYSAFVTKLRAQVEPVLRDGRAAGTPCLGAVYTGIVPVLYKARRSLLDGMIYGLGTDVLLIVVGIVITMRHWSSGVLLFLISTFPTAVAFGLMGWAGIVVDIGSVMTPCVAVGVTVDDVVHFLLWFRRGIQRGLEVPQAVMLAYDGCARAMYQSWGVIGLGLSAFALSSFVPTFRFGALMVVLLTIGLAGNLLFLPALLAGPLGKIIASRVRASGRAL